MLFEAAYGVGGNLASMPSPIKSKNSPSQVPIDKRYYVAPVVTFGRTSVQLDDPYGQLVPISQEL